MGNKINDLEVIKSMFNEHSRFDFSCFSEGTMHYTTWIADKRYSLEFMPKKDDEGYIHVDFVSPMHFGWLLDNLDETGWIELHEIDLIKNPPLTADQKWADYIESIEEDYEEYFCNCDVDEESDYRCGDSCIRIEIDRLMDKND